MKGMQYPTDMFAVNQDSCVFYGLNNWAGEYELQGLRNNKARISGPCDGAM